MRTRGFGSGGFKALNDMQGPPVFRELDERMMEVHGLGALHPSPLAPPRVDWVKTFVAWLTASALTLVFGYVVAPGHVDFGERLAMFFVGLIWLAASVIMVVTQIALHEIRCTKLRHYVFAYPLMVSPILLDSALSLSTGSLGWMLALSLVLALGVVVFWHLYAVVLQGVPREVSHKPWAPDSSLIPRSALAIGLAFVGILVLYLTS